MHDFKQLLVWQKSMDLAVAIYEKSGQLPSSERYNLINQLQRSVVSISSNIAEGCGRSSNSMFRQFLTIAAGSACELETQIILSGRLGYFNDEICSFLLMSIREIQRMLQGLIDSLKL